MLFIIMLMNIASNWVAASFMAAGVPAFALFFSPLRLLVSSASLLVWSRLGEAIMACLSI